MIYYLLGLALLLVVISWIYYNYPFDMTHSGHSYRGDLNQYSEQEANLGRYFQNFAYKVLWSGAQSSCWSFCCSVFEVIASLIGNAIPSARSILAVVAAIAATPDSGQLNTLDNHPRTAHRQLKKEDYIEEEEDFDNEDYGRPQRGGRRRNKKKKKQERRRKHGRRRRQVLRNPIQVEHGMEGATTFQRHSPRDFEQEDGKQPSAVEELLRLDREAAMSAVRKIDRKVGNALGNN